MKTIRRGELFSRRGERDSILIMTEKQISGFFARDRRSGGSKAVRPAPLSQLSSGHPVTSLHRPTIRETVRPTLRSGARLTAHGSFCAAKILVITASLLERRETFPHPVTSIMTVSLIRPFSVHRQVFGMFSKQARRVFSCASLERAVTYLSLRTTTDSPATTSPSSGRRPVDGGYFDLPLD